MEDSRKKDLRILNLSKAGEKATIHTMVKEQGTDPENGSIRPRPLPPAEEGDLMLISKKAGHWDAISKERIPEYYMKARRMCQVKI